MILRPYACVLAGEILWGIELEVERGTITRMGPASAMPDPYVLSTGFVNAHSHLEYRAMLDRIPGGDFATFIPLITDLKRQETEHEVIESCALAARENRASGVAYIAEHSDRIGSAEAMNAEGVAGRIYQELITIGDPALIAERWAKTEESRQHQTQLGFDAVVNPHAIYTVDPDSLRRVAERGEPISIHLAESIYERQLTESRQGPFAEFWQRIGWQVPAHGQSPVEYAHDLGLLRERSQIVHACDLTDEDIEIVAESGAVVAHCPRSNDHLGCPPARIRRMLESGIAIGLGTDSAASAGRPDMFAEMRAALRTSRSIGEGLKPEQVWRMATGMGASSLGLEDWCIQPGSQVPLIKINIAGIHSTEELIERGGPERVEWLVPSE